MAKKDKDQAIEAYEPDFSPAVGGKASHDKPKKRGGIGFFGCTLGSVGIIGISALILTVFMLIAYIYSIQTAGDTTSSIFESIRGIFESEEVIEIDVREFILGVEQQAWLEGARSNNNLDVYASNEWPGILPGRRSLRYDAFVTVTGGVDLELIDSDDFVTDGTSVTVILPPAQIKDCILDEEASAYYDRKCTAAGIIDAGCGGLEEILRERAIQEASLGEHEMLLTDAFDSVTEIVQNLGYSFGYEEVIVLQSEAPVARVANDGTCYQTPEELITPTPTQVPTQTATPVGTP